MSTFNDIDMECVACGETFRGSIWVAIHAGEDPELKDLLLGGELNLVSCPECGQVMFQEHFLLYQEPVAELVAYVYPESQRNQEKELREMMRVGFLQAQETLPENKRFKYDPLLMFGFEELIEMLRREMAGAVQSQIAQVLCRQNNIETTVLRPTVARRHQMMRVLPRTGAGHAATREEILAGIDQLLELNPALDLYAKLRETIQADPEWTL